MREKDRDHELRQLAIGAAVRYREYRHTPKRNSGPETGSANGGMGERISADRRAHSPEGTTLPGKDLRGPALERLA